MSSTNAHWKLFFLFRPNDRRGCSKNMYQMKIRPDLGWIITWQPVYNLREKERFFFFYFLTGNFIYLLKTSNRNRTTTSKIIGCYHHRRRGRFFFTSSPHFVIFLVVIWHWNWTCWFSLTIFFYGRM